MTTTLVFVVPYTSYEILVVSDGRRVAGAAYDPMSLTPPVTWVAGCPRCSAGDPSLPLKVRRAVRCLATLKTCHDGGYTVHASTGTKHTHVLTSPRTAGDERQVAVRDLRRPDLTPLVASARGGVVKVAGGRAYDYRGQVVKRSVRMLLSAREASAAEVRAVLAGLPGDDAGKKGHKHHTELRTLAREISGHDQNT